MGMTIGTGSPGVRRITIKNRDGSVAGTISVTKPARKKTRRLSYNFKELSVQILGTKTSGGARMVTSRAYSRVAMLRQKLRDDSYDSKELKAALAHALKMVEVSKKRMKHLRQEELVKLQEEGAGTVEVQEELPEKADESRDAGMERKLRARQEQIEKQIQEYEKFMRESIRKAGEALDEDGLLSEIAEAVPGEMSPEELELLKKKHRAKEMKEIMEADLQYLKAMFDRLQKEKQDAGGGIVPSGQESAAVMEFAGMEMPVQTAEAPPAAQGGGLDVTV